MTGEEKFSMTETARERIKHLQTLEEKESGKSGAMLRVMVYAGGCSGFKYHLEMTHEPDVDDVVISADGVPYMVLDMDTISMLSGGKLDFVDEVSGSYFRIMNPNAAGSCGCGNSFSA